MRGALRPAEQDVEEKTLIGLIAFLRRNLASQPLPRQAVFSKAALQDNRASIAAPDEDGLTLVSTGTVLQDHHVAIVDPHTLQRREEGQAGEIWVSGPSVAKGYWKRPEETEQTFFAQIAGSPGEHYMRTGDLGFVQCECDEPQCAPPWNRRLSTETPLSPGALPAAKVVGKLPSFCAKIAGDIW